METSKHNIQNASHGEIPLAAVYDTREKSLVKIAILGSLGVGKSALTVRYFTRRFIGDYDQTLEQTYKKQVKIHKVEYDVIIFDTVGRDFDLRGEESILWADGVILLYSTTDRESYNQISKMHQQITELHGSTLFPVILAGNKKDLLHQRNVSYEEAKGMSLQLGCSFFEISVSNSIHEVDEIFEHIIQRSIEYKENLLSCRKDSGSRSVQKMKEVFGKSLFRNRLLSNTLDVDHCYTQTNVTGRLKRSRTCPALYVHKTI